MSEKWLYENDRELGASVSIWFNSFGDPVSLVLYPVNSDFNDASIEIPLDEIDDFCSRLTTAAQRAKEKRDT